MRRLKPAATGCSATDYSRHPTTNAGAETEAGRWVRRSTMPGMADASPDYDPRYLAGVLLFNRHEFFEAHEVWEALWLSADVGTDRRFVQGLIQAAVGLYHFGTNN